MKPIRIGKNLRPYLQKAKDSALLAIEVYNKPAIKFRSAGYIALMVIAWTALFHAIFLHKGINPYRKKKNGRYDTVDGDYRHWELAECTKQFWGDDTQNPIQKNLEFFIPLRNKIEHRHVPELDAAIFGECQALLLNFDEVLGQQFGAKHQIRESLSFSLQLFPSGDSFAQAVKTNKGLADIKRFIDDYRGMLAANVVGSSQFAFKAFLIQVANHDSADALPIQFVQHDKLTPEQRAEFEKFAVMVKWKTANVINSGLLKPSAGDPVKREDAEAILERRVGPPPPDWFDPACYDSLEDVRRREEWRKSAGQVEQKLLLKKVRGRPKKVQPLPGGRLVPSHRFVSTSDFLRLAHLDDSWIFAKPLGGRPYDFLESVINMDSAPWEVMTLAAYLDAVRSGAANDHARECVLQEADIIASSIDATSQ